MWARALDVEFELEIALVDGMQNGDQLDFPGWIVHVRNMVAEIIDARGK